MNEFFIYMAGHRVQHRSKAVFFQQCFANSQIHLHIPDLNQDDFYHLTLTRQIQQVEAIPPQREITVIDPAWWLVALWLAQQNLQIKQVVLLAPALDFIHNSRQVIGDESLRKWQAEGELSLYHYAYQRDELLSYEFMQDMGLYEDQNLRRELPTLILHGIHDEVVPVDIFVNLPQLTRGLLCKLLRAITACPTCNRNYGRQFNNFVI
ncbi:MAG: YqiA/YcfP family alpha/beta fold hydrolase [Thiotrichaceae bacterium]